ncbi:TetR/AcrR family transcriptional regulator [Kiloniella sp.]|uniref:TetR/AcrR family transcriptional regulator n=1 Tax=Kiloniella sp. TaxID=1938587 RepID=UPI003A93362D
MQRKEMEILNAAAVMVREGGYNAFSFRGIAKEVGIKSSSVHYHFPTKELLGVAVVAYYTESFFEALGEPEDLIAAQKDPIEIYIDVFKAALIRDKRMCLCGILAAEVDSLPSSVAEETRIFFKRNIDWLFRSYNLKGFNSTAKIKALQTLATLEGAMITSNILDDPDTFSSIANLILSDYSKA